jgi:hypothetical protein
VNSLLTLLLVVIGLLLLLLSLAVVAFGGYVALDERNRERGIFLAIWWVPAVATSVGILMRDLVTFAIGVLCFVVAGVTLALELRGSRRPARQGPAGRRPASQEPVDQRPVGGRRRTSTGGARGRALYESAKRRLSDKIKEYRKAAS